MERVVLAPALSFDLALFLGAKVSQYLESRAPALEFHLPVDDNRSWHNDQVRAPHAFITG